MAVAALAVMASGAPSATQEKPTFRATTDAVWVLATVVDKDGRLITDLGPADFDVSERGERQDITLFRNDVIPFAIAIMIDSSASMMPELAPGNLAPDIGAFTLMRLGVAELLRDFQPGDRATIGTFRGLPVIGPRFTANQKTLAGWVNATIAGTGEPCSEQWSRNPFAAGMPPWAGTAVWDAVECGIDAVGRDSETPRRVVMVITDGDDNSSTSTAADVAREAEKLGVTVYAIGVGGILGLKDGDLRTLATGTGGSYFRLADENAIPETFARVGEELRHQYVLGISEKTAAPTAKALVVRVSRPGATVRWRRVVMSGASSTTAPSDDRSRSITPAEVSAPIAPVASSVDARLDRYLRGAAGASVPRLSAAGLWSAVKELQRAAPVWIRAGAAADASRRRLAVATYALDFVAAQDDAAWQRPLSVADVIAWARGVLMDGPPSEAERTWYRAGAAILERFEPETRIQRTDDEKRMVSVAGQATIESAPRTGVRDPLAAHFEQAEKRFPGDPAWALGRAVAAELHTWPEPRDTSPAAVLGSASQAISRYRDAATHETTRQEAVVREGNLELRRGHVEDALALFRQAGRPDDRDVRYWLHLFTGRALDLTQHPSEAIAAYRAALEDAPYAQSAAVALSALLAENGQSTEASSLMATTLAIHPAPPDPWTIYTAPDARFWSTWMDTLRSAP